MKHTELPLKVTKQFGSVYIESAKSRFLAQLLPQAGEAEIYAEYIVKACNNYEKLVEALKKVHSVIGRGNGATDQDRQRAYEIATETLQKAEGREVVAGG